jgi:hypothetical protein
MNLSWFIKSCSLYECLAGCCLAKSSSFCLVFRSLLCLITGRPKVQAECSDECCNVSDLKVSCSRKSSVAYRDDVISTW